MISLRTRAFLGYGAGEEQYQGKGFVQETNGSSWRGGEAEQPYAGNVEANRRDPDPKRKAAEGFQLFGDPGSGTEPSGFAAAGEGGLSNTMDPQTYPGMTLAEELRLKTSGSDPGRTEEQLKLPNKRANQ